METRAISKIKIPAFISIAVKKMPNGIPKIPIISRKSPQLLRFLLALLFLAILLDSYWCAEFPYHAPQNEVEVPD